MSRGTGNVILGVVFIAFGFIPPHNWLSILSWISGGIEICDGLRKLDA